MDKTEKISFRVSEELKKRIKERADEERRTVADYIRLIVTKDLEKK